MFFESLYLNLSVLAVLIFALLFDYITKFFSYWYVRHVPYKTSIPLFGSDYHRVLGIRDNTEDMKADYDKSTNEKYFGRVKSRIPDLIVKDADSIKSMLSSDFVHFRSRGLCLDKSRDVCLRDNLFYAENENWTVLREKYVSLLNSMNCELENLGDYLPGTNGDANIQEILSKVLDKVFEDLLVGDVCGSLVKDLSSAAKRRTFIERFKTYFKNIFPSVYTLFGLTTLSGEPSSKTKSVIEKSVILSNIKNLNNLYEFRAQEKRQRSEKELAISMLMSFITEGYIPCLNALTAFFYELALNPLVQEKSRNSILNDNKSEYLDAALKEALRLHPPYSLITRQCTKTYHPEGGLLIDKRVTINIPVDALHKDEVLFAEAKTFNPDRFLDDEGAFKHSYTYLPFGAGPRKCVGEQLALNIMRKISKAVLEKYNIEACERTPSELPMVDHNFGRLVDRDIWLRLKSRI